VVQQLAVQQLVVKPSRAMADSQNWSMACHPESCFADEKSAKDAVNVFARSHGYGLVVKNVCRDRRGFRRRVVMACDRHGQRRSYVSTSVNRRVNAASRRCGCQMELNIVRSGEVGTDTERWTIQHRDRVWFITTCHQATLPLILSIAEQSAQCLSVKR
jgi:hypothetical protein